MDPNNQQNSNPIQTTDSGSSQPVHSPVTGGAAGQEAEQSGQTPFTPPKSLYISPEESSRVNQPSSAAVGVQTPPVENLNKMNPPGQSQEQTIGPIVPPSPKKKFPFKLLLIILGGIILVLGGVFAAQKLLKQEKKPTQITLTWWNLWEDEAVVKPLIQEFESQNPQIKINYVKESPQDYRERLMNNLAKGSGPDIFVFHNTWVPVLSRELDSLPSSFMSAADMAKDYFYVVSADLTSQGKILGVPLGYDALTLFINEDIFQGANLNPPTTWVELRDDARLLTKVENGKIVQSGVALGRTENVDHWQEILALMLIQNGVNLSNPESDLVGNALLFYTTFSKTDKVWDETLPPSTSAFAAGKLAMYFGPSWRAFNIQEENPSLKFRTVPLPQVPKEDPNEPDIAYATYWAQGVSVKSKNREAAWNFLKFLSSKESLEKMYKQASLTRGFGEAYPRTDMANLLLDHPVLGSVVKLAPEARSWFLASRTFDGSTGINSQLNKYFEDAVNALNKGEDLNVTVETLIKGIKQVLIQYGLSKE